MFDREVQEVVESTRGEEASPRPFSTYFDIKHLIVLGDPGAGKTELFKWAATGSSGLFLTVRTLLTTPVDQLPNDRSLWIDGLDESRSGRGDRETVNAVISRLWELKPPAVRLSCRVADWLGKTDLAAFMPYFENNGGAPMVVRLSPLTTEEQRRVLSQVGFGAPTDFLKEAQRRGLQAMLTNPQSLLMLAKAVDGDRWPATRAELFDRAVTLLLQEHNPEHSEPDEGPGRFSPAELLATAGALCALRLISDCAGFCLKPSSYEDIPSYREVDLATVETRRAVLMRRVFVSTAEPDVVDYAHRTIAEYLGARWLAERISQGLPLGRVRALLGFDGRPASSLRGLHAWLAVLSPEAAPLLVDADPLGVVMYADCAAMTKNHRLHLLQALCHLSERDEWFYFEHRHVASISGLVSKDMIERFEQILGNAAESFSIRLLLMDAMKQGAPLPQMHDCLRVLLTRESEPYALRACSLELLVMTEAGCFAVLDAYEGFGSEEDGLRLKAEAIENLYGKGLGKEHFHRFLHEVLASQYRMSIGEFYGIEDCVPADEIVGVLNLFDSLQMPEEDSADDYRFESYKKSSIISIYQGLIVRYLNESDIVDAGYVLNLLKKRLEFSPGHEIFNDLLAAIMESDGLPRKMADSWVGAVTASELRSAAVFNLQQITLGTVNDGILLSVLCDALCAASKEKEVALYDHILRIVFREGPSLYPVFEKMYAHANGDPQLIVIRDKWCSTSLDDWMAQEMEEQRRRAISRRGKEQRDREERYNQFDESLELIKSGEHLGWLGEIGQVYFRHRSYGKNALPVEKRLSDWFGPERAPVAMDGLMALIARRTITPLAEIIDLLSEHKYFYYWHAVIAGLDLCSKNNIGIEEYSDEYLSAAIAIAAFPGFSYHEQSGGVAREWFYRWIEDAVRQRPRMVIDTYAALVKCGLASDEQHPSGLYKLQEKRLAGPHRFLRVSELLYSFPEMRPESLRPLLFAAIADGNAESLKDLIDFGVRACGKTRQRKENMLLWLASGFMADMHRYQGQIEALSGDLSKKMVWELLDAGGLNRGVGSKRGDYGIDQMEFVARYAARVCPYVSHPGGATTGRNNAWDMSMAITNILSVLASQTSDAAHEALRRLSEDQNMSSYAGHAKHGLEQQRARMIDARYRVPSWQEAVSTLSNRVPKSAPDLHAYVLDQLSDIDGWITSGNTKVYKRFWNEDKYGRIKLPKQENSARDVLIDLLRERLQPIGLRAEPEGHMAHDKRTDIVIYATDLKCVIELKRDCHEEVWSAAMTQLDRFYVRDPEAYGHGIYGVFWYGDRRCDRKQLPRIPKAPDGDPSPSTAAEMRQRLESILPEDWRYRIRVVVFDVSGEIEVDRAK